MSQRENYSTWTLNVFWTSIINLQPRIFWRWYTRSTSFNICSLSLTQTRAILFHFSPSLFLLVLITFNSNFPEFSILAKVFTWISSRIENKNKNISSSLSLQIIYDCLTLSPKQKVLGWRVGCHPALQPSYSRKKRQKKTPKPTHNDNWILENKRNSWGFCSSLEGPENYTQPMSAETMYLGQRIDQKHSWIRIHKQRVFRSSVMEMVKTKNKCFKLAKNTGSTLVRIISFAVNTIIA